MALIDWNDELSVGVCEMDLQHQKLVDLINQLHDSMRQRRGRQRVGQVVAELVSYAEEHFSAEEHLLSKHEYPGRARQTSEHGRFIQKIGEFRRRIELGNLSLSIEVMDFLRDWLTGHIQKSDKEYGPYLNERGVT
jgi:hemerythrin-like metal-binding protein